MKKCWLLFAIALVWTNVTQAQIQKPVKWKFSLNRVSDTEALVVLQAKLEDGWHIYGNDIPEGGPIATSINFEKNDTYSLEGSIETKGKKVTKYEKVFEMELNYLEKRAVFTQKIKTKPGVAVVLNGEIEFQACNDESCLLPETVPFALKLEGETAAQVNVENAILKPVTWNFTINQFSETEAELVATAKVEDHWHLYSINNPDPELGGPKPVIISFNANESIVLNGKVDERGKLQDILDPVFKMQTKFYEHEVSFAQKIKINNTDKPVTGKIEFQTCDDKQCLFDNVEFEYNLASGEANVLLLGEEATINKAGGFAYLRPSIDLNAPVKSCGEEVVKKDTSLLKIFILGLLGGLIALLTPCVFPMIPLTVSFFTKSSSDKKQGRRNAFIYGFFIFAIYLLLSLPFHLLDSIDPTILNSISTNVPLNVAFFVVFIVFAISFFGFFEITLPSGIANKASSGSSVGGLIGIFFMALTLAIVSFSCTGPILGSLLVGSLTSNGGAMQLTAGMGGFGLALAMPFALFAAFPGWLNSLPQSGGWLNSVKVILGFIEVALALKFLSNADMVGNWGLVKYEVFLGIWLIIAVLMALYLFGILKFPHDSPVKKLSLGRMSLGGLCIAAAIYLALGFRLNESTKTYDSLSLLSGLAPPAGYSILHPMDCPNNLPCFHDYEEALAFAKKVNKPLMIDFTGKACVNCRKMEENVWNKPGVEEKLKNEYVIVSLYVDFDEELPAQEQGVFESSDGRKVRITTVGNKWGNLQTETFKINSQPWYVLVSPDEQLLNQPRGYTPDIDEYSSFLQCGLEAFKSLNP